jgi:hypothetical protein
VIANRILANEDVIDAFGHVSVRHPERPDRYFLARSRSPELVERGDLMEFDLENRPIDQRGRTMYSERPIHGSTYKARPDVMSVCHNHARSLIPFGITGTAIRPVLHVAQHRRRDPRLGRPARVRRHGPPGDHDGHRRFWPWPWGRTASASCGGRRRGRGARPGDRVRVDLPHGQRGAGRARWRWAR